jgi:hypothetical protein
MVDRADIQYLCCDRLAELTMSVLNKQKSKKPDLGYTTDIAAAFLEKRQPHWQPLRKRRS